MDSSRNATHANAPLAKLSLPSGKSPQSANGVVADAVVVELVSAMLFEHELIFLLITFHEMPSQSDPATA
jgi:hypothetical protein